jgi:hypothetical protein
MLEEGEDDFLVVFGLGDDGGKLVRGRRRRQRPDRKVRLDVFLDNPLTDTTRSSMRKVSSPFFTDHPQNRSPPPAKARRLYKCSILS